MKILPKRTKDENNIKYIVDSIDNRPKGVSQRAICEIIGQELDVMPKSVMRSYRRGKSLK